MACCHSEKKTNSSSLPVPRLLRSALLLLLLLVLSPSAFAVTYNVSADGDGIDLYEAMDLAEAGDTVNLQNGTYDSALVSVRDGEFGSPITVAGGAGGHHQGVLQQPLRVHHAQLHHAQEAGNCSTVQLPCSCQKLPKGFSVEGKIGSNDTDQASWVNKCVYVEGPGANSSAVLDGFVMEDMVVQNCGGECVRLKDSVVNAQVTGNTISRTAASTTTCSTRRTRTEKGSTSALPAPSSAAHRIRYPPVTKKEAQEWTNGEDTCNGNVVSRNLISTSGNECVDIKEGSSGNVIEDNFRSDQLNAESGCYDSRGDGNTFRCTATISMPSA
ncbi:FirrV-1-B30 precursor [Ectocarpus siliculosus]|uniref:FirrV-1-B30 n=1 Tax=Ectocarpus siliculosus TaxID=2880 RepID=D7FZD3_ECTSI|nr:FirrV-1-B30 precursor [Ectocarpus siliculosus]|eukprot:CBJ32750.1 FirrV-1-B30 precursor [Ectocarpus siliculosus]